MAKFVLSFRGRADHMAGADEEAAWGQWFGELGATVVDFGNRVGAVSCLGNTPTSSDGGRNVLTGYVLVAADDLESAVGIAKGCPGLHHGGGVEVGEIVDMS